MADARGFTLTPVGDDVDNRVAILLAAAKADEANITNDKAKTAMSRRQGVLDELTKERNDTLDRWADAEALGLATDEIALNVYQKEHLKFLFGQTGFNPPVPARNPVSVSMHNPKFSAALWAINTEAYRRKGKVSYVVQQLGISTFGEDESFDGLYISVNNICVVDAK